MENKIQEVLSLYLEEEQIDVVIGEIMRIINTREDQELKSRREQIADINQWTAILMTNRKTIRERILWSMIADINNRTTD